ncbi:MAG: putative DNA-binding domain-containing protein [Myxococcales bacterium]|nr:putative DNA-binding domain-containing protein [Myxococcales bacterium]MBK7198922.1 putative DNA-binding domain-containing protein [Myxococcales bacterium]MBP6844022.1 putative DNA-binding domain-containing protein [Kofleriaceae bacterium]
MTDELATWQRAFGAVLRAPLARRAGTLTPPRDAYPAAIVTALGGDRRGLAAYHVQYWCRLFEALQHEFPLTCALVGAWTFNQLAEGFLAATPPRGHDLARVADGFDAWLKATLPIDGVALPAGDARPRAALLEAATIDQAFRAVFAQPPPPPPRLSRAGLARARLVRSPAAVVVVERWPLVALRHGQRHAPEAAVGLPPPHPAGPQAWVIAAVADGQRVSPLSPLEAALVDRLTALPVAAALAEVERAHPADAPAALAAAVHAALARTVELGLWTGAAPG